MILHKLFQLTRRSKQLVKYGGFTTFVKGCLKRFCYGFLRHVYHFDHWHTAPVEHREYGLEICCHVNALIRKEQLQHVVELGCGLGDVLARINADDLVGFDIEPNVLRAGRSLHRQVEFHQGSFSAVKDRCIDVLIAVNFTHGIDPEQLQQEFLSLLQNNRVRYIVVDAVDYKYFHNFDEVFGRSCQKVWQSPELQHSRTIQVYKNSSL